MHISVIMVQSLNGKITRGEDPHIYTWTSPEDQQFFFEKIEQSELIIMGRKTYDAAKSLMKHKRGRLRVVLTHKPQQFLHDAIPNQLEFSSMSPSDLVKAYKERGFTSALVVGGARVNAEFLAQNLADELYITIEPALFGKGRELLDGEVNISLALKEIRQLNHTGTLLLRYSILK